MALPVSIVRALRPALVLQKVEARRFRQVRKSGLYNLQTPPKLCSADGKQ